MWEIMNSVFNKSSEGLMASENFISGKKFVMVSLTGGAMTLVMGQYYKTFFWRSADCSNVDIFKYWHEGYFSEVKKTRTITNQENATITKITKYTTRSE